MRFVVLDTETTDHDPYIGRVVEVAAVAVDLEARRVEPLYASLCNPGLSLSQLQFAWICSQGYLRPEEILTAPLADVVAGELRAAITGLPWTSFNTSFDEGFLTQPPWSMPRPALHCLMRAATPVCRIPGYYEEYKWPRLEEAYELLVRQLAPAVHRAYPDARRAAEVALALDRLGASIVPTSGVSR